MTMTAVEFRRKYHDFAETDRKSAEDEAALINREGIDGGRKAVVKKFWKWYCLMLDDEARLLAVDYTN
jgi:hypothetical protein